MKEILLIFSGLVCGVGTILGITHFSTLETVGDFLKDSALSFEGADNEWEFQNKTLFTTPDESLTSPLLAIKSKIKNGEFKSSEIKKWCQKIKSSTFKSVIIPVNEQFKNNIERYCVFTIGKKMGNDAIDFKDWRSPLLIQEKIMEFYDNKDKKEDITVPKELEGIRSMGGILHVLSRWQDFLNLCQQIYKLGYSGSEDNNYKFAKKYCSNKVEKPRLPIIETYKYFN